MNHDLYLPTALFGELHGLLCDITIPQNGGLLTMVNCFQDLQTVQVLYNWTVDNVYPIIRYLNIVNIIINKKYETIL